jgi:dihydroorotase
MAGILIQGGRLISPANNLNQLGDLLLVDGVFGATGGLAEHSKPDHIINAEEKWVVPSFIDLSHVLREPGFEHKATIASECAAAAKGGFGALCCPPDTSPVNDSAAVTNFILDQAAAVGNMVIYPVGAMTKQLQGEQLSEMFALREAGCVAVTNLRRPFRNLQVARRCLEYACSQDIKVIVCPQDWALAQDGCAHDGWLASRLGLSSIPVVAETLEVAQWLILAEETQASIHFAQLSAARSVAMIAEAKKRGLTITADVALANLCYTDQALEGYNSMYHVEPPLRSENDRLGLLQGVNDGIIDAICSHHQPHEQSSRQAPFAETSAGMSQVELVWPLLLRLIEQNELQLDRAIEAFTVGPARAMGLPLPDFSIGNAANVAIVDISKHWRVSEETLWSSGKNTPLLGAEVTGKPVATFYQGIMVYSDKVQ